MGRVLRFCYGSLVEGVRCGQFSMDKDLRQSFVRRRAGSHLWVWRQPVGEITFPGNDCNPRTYTFG